MASLTELLSAEFETGVSNVNESASTHIRWQQQQTMEEQTQSMTLSLTDPTSPAPVNHPLGPNFNQLTTPLRTEELNLLTHIPLSG